MRLVAHEIEICSDCLMWIVNGDDSGIEDIEARFAVHTAPGIEGAELIAPKADSEEYFSHTPCDACQRPESGMRTTCIAHYPTTRGPSQ